MDINISNLFKKRDAESRSLSAENYSGEKGKGGMATEETTLNKASATCARELGPGWKLSPCLPIPAGETVTIMDNEGPGGTGMLFFEYTGREKNLHQSNARWAIFSAAPGTSVRRFLLSRSM